MRVPLKEDATSCISSSLWVLEEASQTDPVTTKPLASHSFKHWLRSDWFREQVWTEAPKPASSSTTAWLQNRHIIVNKQQKRIKREKRFRRKQSSRPDSASAAGDESGEAFERPSGYSGTVAGLRHVYAQDLGRTVLNHKFEKQDWVALTFIYVMRMLLSSTFFFIYPND